MLLSYRGQKHALGEPSVTIRRKALKNDLDDIWAWEEIWDIELLLTTQEVTADSAQAAIATKTGLIETRYGSDGGDLILYKSNGAESHHVLRNADCVGGTLIYEPPSYPDGKGVEATTKRTVTLQVGGIVPIPQN